MSFVVLDANVILLCRPQELAVSQLSELYQGERAEILKFIPEGSRRILDIGCSTGDLGAAIKRGNKAIVTGIEINPDAARIAKEKLDAVFVGGVEDVISTQDLGCFDAIIFADVVEHLISPADVIRACSRLLSPEGIAIFSIPNVRHISVLTELLFCNEWKYRESGILDRSHLRFFTDQSFERLLRESGLVVRRKASTLSLRGSQFFDCITCGFFRRFLAAQYIFVTARKVAA